MEAFDSPEDSGKETTQERAFESLYKSLYHTLLGIACHYVDPETGKDIVQDTFLKIWNSPESYSQVRDPRFYLCRTVRNECLNFLRSKKTENQYRNGVKLSSDDFFYHVLLEEETFTEMRKAVDQLPEIYRQVLTLNLEGKRDKEIAEKLHISLDNVKTRKKRGKSMLRGILQSAFLVFLLEYI